MRKDSVSLLDVAVADGESGPVVVLSGEADLTNLAGLNSALDSQLSAGVRLLTVDLSKLLFADSATIAALLLAARALRDRGGQLQVLRPGPAVARILELTGADQILAVRDGC